MIKAENHQQLLRIKKYLLNAPLSVFSIFGKNCVLPIRVSNFKIAESPVPNLGPRLQHQPGSQQAHGGFCYIVWPHLGTAIIFTLILWAAANCVHHALVDGSVVGCSSMCIKLCNNRSYREILPPTDQPTLL